MAAKADKALMVRVAVVELDPTTGLLTEQETVTGRQFTLTGLDPLPVMVSATVPLCPEASERLVGFATMVSDVGSGGLMVSFSTVEELPEKMLSPA